MPQRAQEYIEITALIKGILNGYPGNAAILREYLQNSDDAKATCQTFILDEREFSSDSLVDAALKGTQGPALLALNDGLIRDDDWTALRKIHSSSKKADDSQTGKNGLGFRASYHLTDNPHILSGRGLMILDPHEEFKDHPGGIFIDIIDEAAQFKDQLAPFSSIVGDDLVTPYNGTIFRLPLRTASQATRSKINDAPTPVLDIYNILGDFASSDLKRVILFLKHITKIEVKHIDSCGVVRSFGAIEIEKLDLSRRVGTVFRKITTTHDDGTQIIENWCFHHLVVDKDEAAQVLSSRLGYDIGSRLTVEKLVPSIDIALPLQDSGTKSGYYTLLPLPITCSGFPIHLNAVFALAPDRQAFKNIEEIGQPHSRERLLVEWNKTIFDRWTPVAWANILPDILPNIAPSTLWDLLPSEVSEAQSYRSDLLRHLIEEIVRRDLAIFPTIPRGGKSFLVSLSNKQILLAQTEPGISLDALSSVGFIVVQPPPHIFSILESLSTLPSSILSPQSLYTRLHKEFPQALNTDENAAIKAAIIDYLVFSRSTPALANLVGLPLFKTSSGSPLALDSSINCIKYIIPRSAKESSLFAEHPRMVAWSSMSDNLATELKRSPTSKILNVSRLSADDVITFLCSQVRSLASDETSPSDASTIPWLVEFWTWVIDWNDHETFFQKINLLSDCYLLPTSSGTLRKLSSKIVDFLHLSQDHIAINAWNTLGIHPIHKDIPYAASLRLQSASFVQIPGTSEFIRLLMRSCDITNLANLSPPWYPSLRQSLVSGLPLRSGMIFSEPENKTFLSLPIFMARKFDDEFQLRAISGPRLYVYVHDDKDPLPVMSARNTLFVDTRDAITKQLTSVADSKSAKILKELDLLDLAIENWSLQPENLRDAWIEKFLYQWSKLPPSLQSKLRSFPFVTVNGLSARVPPRNLIDPQSSLADLYTNESGKFPAGQFLNEDCLVMMRNLGFINLELSTIIVTERLEYFCSSSLDADRSLINKANAFIKILDRGWSPLYERFVKQRRAANWLPLSISSLISPTSSRDKSERGLNNHKYYYDKVLTILDDVEITSPQFRLALGWSDPVPFEVLLLQFRRTIALLPSSDRNNRIICLVNYLACLHEAGHLSDAMIVDIRDAVRDQLWIPVARSPHETVRTEQALLSDPNLPDPFRAIDPTISESFLLALGCTARPTLKTLVYELSKAKLATSMVSFLDEMVKFHPGFDRKLPIIPTAGSPFHKYPLDRVYYRDMKHIHLCDAIIGRVAAHDHISRVLAQKLGMDFLSSLTLDDDDDEDDDEDNEQMSEDLTGRIRGFLRDYDPRYAINEFLANANDAKATRFSMLLLQEKFTEAGEDVISPAFQSLHQEPILMLFNNATLSQADFLGLRRIGKGGKLDQPHTHGRHGLGALSAYYFTDVVTVISGEFVMFLDPSGQFLPPMRDQRRTAYKKRIVDISSHYPDQFKPYNNKFGFSSLAPRYDGTIFCLHLKASMSEKSCDVNMVSNFIQTTYRDLARHAFFFTNLEQITAEDRSPWLLERNNQSLWSITVKRTPVSRLDVNFKRCDLKIVEESSISSSKHGKSEEEWMVATSEDTTIPSSHQIVATSLKLSDQNPMTIQLAIRTSPIANAKEPESHHLFSTLQLPKTTSLPFHFNARLAISSNRQDVVFYPADSHNQKDPKTAFNSWIMETILPPLYLACLAHLVHASLGQSSPFKISRSQWWLTNAKDEISCLVRRGLLDILPSADYKIFFTGDRKWTSFSESIFSKKEPLDVTTFLLYVRAPRFIAEHRNTGIPENIPGISPQTVNPRFVQTTLNANVSLDQIRRLHAAERVSSKMLYSLLDYICGPEACGDVVGLPILLLKSGELVAIPGSNDTPVYHTETPSLKALFRSSNFVSEGYAPRSLEYLQHDVSVNVVSVTEHHVITLILAELPNHLPDADRRSWITLFWDTYDALPGPPSLDSLEKAGLPLLRIRGTSDYLPLRACIPQEVVYSANIPDSEDGVRLRAFFQRLDIKVLGRTGNAAVDKALSKRFPDLLTNILQSVKEKGAQILTSALRLDELEELSAWIRTEIGRALSTWQKNAPPIENHFLLALPIWAAYTNRGEALREANNLKVVPTDTPAADIQPYLVQGFSIATGTPSLLRFLRYCQGLPTHATLTGQFTIMSFCDILGVVQLPTRLLGRDAIREYKIFAESMLKFPASEIHLGDRFIPDEHGELRSPEDLYDHSIPLFAEAMQYNNRPAFVHLEFRDLLPSLRAVGLRHDVNVETFRSSAIAVQQAVQSHLESDRPEVASLLSMSQTVFSAYQTTIAGLAVASGNMRSSWASLDTIAFVRPKDIRRQGLSYGPVEEFCSRESSILVPPSRLVRPDLEPIAWTQRVLFYERPMDTILAVNSSLGVPDATEVVEHLKVLTTAIAIKHPQNSMLLSDIKATYKWLNDHSEEAREALVLAEQYSIFLNVDDPLSDSWDGRWSTAKELVLNLTYDHRSLKGVKGFLQAYGKLLLAAGSDTLTIFDRQVLESEGPESDSALLQRMRRTFNEMRKAGELTDLILEPAYISPDDEAVDPSDLRGHRCFLAATIPHFRDSSQGWRIGPNGETKYHGTPFGAKTLLNYVYTGELALPIPPETISEHDRALLLRDLLELLEIANCWDMPKFKEKLQWYIIHKYDMVQKLAYQHDIMQDSAVKHNASALKEDLDQFRRNNERVLRELQAQ